MNAWQKHLEELYIDEGLTTRQIGTQIGFSQTTIYNSLKDAGIPIRHGNWKGGKHKTRRGYILRQAPGHPRANSKNYVYEHILIWEEIHGRPLPKGWSVHHINGIKSDNRPVNLAGLPNMKHCRVFEVKARRIRALETRVRLLEQALEQNQLMFLTLEN